MERVIFHIDVNSAFLSWEAAYRIHVLGDRQDLCKIASAVGGDIKKRHGIILANLYLLKSQVSEPVTLSLTLLSAALVS